jgi:hypothetical protein
MSLNEYEYNLCAFHKEIRLHGYLWWQKEVREKKAAELQSALCWARAS